MNKINKLRFCTSCEHYMIQYGEKRCRMTYTDPVDAADVYLNCVCARGLEWACGARGRAFQPTLSDQDMIAKLAKCCHSPSHEIKSYGTTWYIECLKCGLLSPVATTRSDAVGAFNATVRLANRK